MLDPPLFFSSIFSWNLKQFLLQRSDGSYRLPGAVNFGTSGNTGNSGAPGRHPYYNSLYSNHQQSSGQTPSNESGIFATITTGFNKLVDNIFGG